MATASYRFVAREPVAEGLRRVALEEMDAAIGEATCRELDDRAAIHQARKSCKRIRGLLALYRGGLPGRSRENENFRALGCAIAPLRDADSLLEALDSLRAHVGDAARRRLEPVEEALLLHRDRIVASGADPATLRQTVADEMRRARGRVGSWSPGRPGWAAIEKGFRREYRRARKALELFHADASGERVHELRKATKRHWYHTCLLEDAWPERFGPRRVSLKALADLLGEDHDLGILLALAPGLGLDDALKLDAARIAELGSAIHTRQAALRDEALPAATSLYEQGTKSFTADVEREWRARS